MDAICVCTQPLSHVRLSATSRTVAHQPPLSLEFYRQKYWSGLKFPTTGDLPDPGIEPASLSPPVLADGLFITVPPGMPLNTNIPFF